MFNPPKLVANVVYMTGADSVPAISPLAMICIGFQDRLSSSVRSLTSTFRNPEDSYPDSVALPTELPRHVFMGPGDGFEPPHTVSIVLALLVSLLPVNLRDENLSG